MYKVEGTKITMVRGDTFVAAISLTRNGETYTPSSDDSIIFSAKKRYGDLKPCIQKTVSVETMELKLSPADTARLAPGNYIYELEIQFEDGGVDTFIPGGTLVLLPEVGVG